MKLLDVIPFCLAVQCCYSSLTQETTECSYEFDQTRCVYNVYCERYYNLPFYLYGLFRAACTEYVYYDGGNYPPVFLKMINFERDLQLAGTYGSHVIQTLELSNNGGDEYPYLPPMENLAKLDMSQNSLTSAKLSYQFFMRSLVEIDYSYNNINSIDTDTSKYMYTNLKKLNIAHNKLEAIEDNIFSTFSELESLDLSHNFISELHNLTFEGLNKLTYLRLSHNNISDMNLWLQQLNKLEELDLSNNQLQHINLIDFPKSYSLKKLNLNSNSILSIANVFVNFRLLHELDLGHNKLESIHETSFANATKLQNINLSYNNIKYLPKYLLSGKNITDYSVKGNNLEGSILNGTFEGLHCVEELDLSYQQITSIEDYAFYGLEKLHTLLLNNNNIQSVARHSFKTLQNLDFLDLSHNYLLNIDFDKGDLVNLRGLVLNSNEIKYVKSQSFNGCNLLQMLDLANNNISLVESNSFQSLENVTIFKIYSNPLRTNSDNSIFTGLHLLPILDISSTQLSIVTNNSFKDMIHLKELNMSNSKIHEIQFNAFSKAGAIEILDISFNELRSFDVNTTKLLNLRIIMLDNNFLHIISSTSFKGLSRLLKVTVSHNNINTVDDDALVDLQDLDHLDLSFNSELHINISQIRRQQNLTSLTLSAIKTGIQFSGISNEAISYLDMSGSRITNITALGLTLLTNLSNLILSGNEIVTVNVGALANLTLLRALDLSFNNISHIHPGAFKDNLHLHLLNISHNYLFTITYGIFRGLNELNTIDMSYNNIDNLRTERFDEVKSLKELIADHNKIDYVEISEFESTGLKKLSIGYNPIPCHVLVNLKKTIIPFRITAIEIDYNSQENVDGITCNIEHNKATKPTVEPNSSKVVESEKILIEIRDILLNKTADEDTVRMNMSSGLLNNMNKLASTITEEVNDTNSLLREMLNVMTHVKTHTVSDEKESVTIKPLSLVTSASTDQQNEKSNSDSFLFIEVCVGLILIVLVGFTLYTLYKSGTCVKSRRFYRNQQQSSDTEENSHF